MAGELLLINPRKRRTHHRRRKNPESHAKRSRAAKLGWKRRERKHRRRNPESHRERVSAARKGWAHRRRNPIRHHRRRNPIGRRMDFFAPVMPAVMGSVGAIGLSVLWGYAPIPANYKTGTIGTAVKIGGALALGAILAKTGMKKQTASEMVIGMVTVELAGMLKGLIQTSMPNITLGEVIPDAGMGYLSPGVVMSENPQALTNQSSGAYSNGGVPSAYDYAMQTGQTY